ncbi:uncharacterized protein LOC110974179 isoform X2 [Acanthaster planci]|uniref:Uncharacterized protein LOC110974179 isoform X2 n=1 Tax=Acanthaster planci TaxID=133434 RepID=A0A8B7XMV5_ACAPL|nr:uncharacterized protein LOC110974179 isoform X2 [Acanthaster planci]
MQLISETNLAANVPMVLTMSTAEKVLMMEDSGPPLLQDAGQGLIDDDNGNDGDNYEPSSACSSRPDSLNLDSWCVVSETALTKEMLQHLSKPEEIASLAASYLTRQLFAHLGGILDPATVDQVYKAVQEVSENDTNILRNFIAELNEEQDREERPELFGSNDNENSTVARERHCPKAVIKVLLDLLMFSPVPVEHNILWVRLLSQLRPHDLPTLVDLKVAATVLGTMTVHVGSAEIQLCGCQVLEPLAKFKPTPLQKAPVRESGIEVLLKTLEAHINDATIVLAVFVVLANLTSTMVHFTSWVIQQGYAEEETEKLVMMSMAVTDYIKENGLVLLDRAGTTHQDHTEIQTEFYRVMACFGYHSTISSSEDASPSSSERKHSILKSPESPRMACPQRRVTFSYDLDTRVEYQCSDSDSDDSPEEPKRHTVCGGETVWHDHEREGVFLDGDQKSRAFKGRLGNREDKKLSFPNFEMEEDYLQMWQHILGEGLFSSICCDLAKLERDFDEMGSGSLKSSSSDETVDLQEPVISQGIGPRPLTAKQHLEGPCFSLPVRCEIRAERSPSRSRFATVPGFRRDFHQPDWQVQDTDSAVKNRLSAEYCCSPPKTKIRPTSEPPPCTKFGEEDKSNEESNSDDEKNVTEYSEIDLVEGLIWSGKRESDKRLIDNEVLYDDLNKEELENKGNEEKEHIRECSTSEKTLTGDTTEENEKESLDSNSFLGDPFSLDSDLLPIDQYLENRSLADDILSSFGIYENSVIGRDPIKPVVSGPYGTFTLPGVSLDSSETDDVFLDSDTTMGDSYKFSNEESSMDGEPVDEHNRSVSSAQQATQQAFAKAFATLRNTPCLFHSSLTSSPTSSISSASLSLAEWNDLEALTEDMESADTDSLDTVTSTQDTPPNSEADVSTSCHTIPKQRKLNFMHRFSERKTQNCSPPPKPRRTWYYRSSADVRKSLMSSFPPEVDGVLGSDGHHAPVTRLSSRGSKRGMSLLAFGKTGMNVSCDSGVVTGDDEEGPTANAQESFPTEHFYEEVYMSKAELKPTLYERISRKGHYADFKKANKVQVPEDNSTEATYTVCTLWVNKQCVEALVTFDHLTKQLVSPYSIVPAVRELEGTRKSSLGTTLDEMENDYPAWTSILNVLATEESKWTLSLTAQVLPIIDRLFYTKDEAIMDASVGLVQLLIRKFGHEIEKHHSGGLFRTRFRDDCRTCFLWLNKLYSRVSDLLKRDSQREDDLDSLLHLSLLSSLRESLKPFNGRISRGLAM